MSSTKNVQDRNLASQTKGFDRAITLSLQGSVEKDHLKLRLASPSGIRYMCSLMSAEHVEQT